MAGLKKYSGKYDKIAIEKLTKENPGSGNDTPGMAHAGWVRGNQIISDRWSRSRYGVGGFAIKRMLKRRKVKKMKASFPGYYHPTNDEFAEIWDNCVFILDANMLLNFYRYTPETRDELTSILEDVKDRIWVPHQIALEYHRNRRDVIQKQANTYKKIRDSLNSYQKKIKNDLHSLTEGDRHPFIATNLLIEKIKTTFEEILEDLRTLQESHPDLINNDPIMETITNLFEGKVGNPFLAQDIDQIFRDGKKTI